MKTCSSLTLVYLFLSLISSSCDSINDTNADNLSRDYDHKLVPYKFYQPEAVLSLDGDLKEVSGLSMLGNQELAVVEDENGLLYILNEEDGQIIRKIRFAEDGDYEGVEVIERTAYVIKSNGDLYSFLITDQDRSAPRKIGTAFSSENDVEGLGVEGEHLLIACKKEGSIAKNELRGKGIYVFNIVDQSVVKGSGFGIEVQELERHLESKTFFNKINDFNPSAVAVHPLNGDIYVLSATGILVILSSSRELREIVSLKKDLYRQPEGICFATSGTLYISTEGVSEGGKIFKLLLVA